MAVPSRLRSRSVCSSLPPLLSYDIPHPPYTPPPLDLRYTLVVVCMFLIFSILCPVLWYLWIHAGSANANFFFAITLTYALAQVSTHSNCSVCVE